MSGKLRRILVWVSVGVVALAAASWGVSIWRGSVVERQRERAWQGVQALVTEQRWVEAVGEVRAFWRELGHDLPAAEVQRWRRLDAETSQHTGDVARLVWLEQQDPALLAQMETASLLLVRTLATAGQAEEAERIRANWRGREGRPELWLAVDVDRLFAQRKIEEAAELLRSREFDEAADVGRRLRLAMLASNPRAAWDALQEAMQLDPRNPDVRTFRGQILERVGAADPARVEHVAALVAAPSDPVRRDQLAQFYLRHGNGDLALRTWRDGLAESMPDFFWLRVRFWGRLWGDEGGELPARPPGPWAALDDMLAQIPVDRFWVEPEGEPTAELRRVERRPEVAILRVLEALRVGDEAAALHEIGAIPADAKAWAPDTMMAIAAVLRWRQSELEPQPGDLKPSVPGVTSHVLAEQLAAWPETALPADTAALLRGPGAWPALMLAAGWREAVLTMAGPVATEPIEGAPDWYHYGLAAVLRERRGTAAAVSYLARGPKTPALRLQLAEIGWSAGDAAAERELGALVGELGDVGYRAAWLLATAALERGEAVEAQRWVRANADLAAENLGQELLARAALALGEEAEVSRIYEALGTESLEAGAFLAARAFAAGQWSEARRLTVALLDRFPTEMTLRSNLTKIDEAEVRAAGGEKAL